MSIELPTFLELAKHKIKLAGRKDKVITIKVAINTARMMVEREEKSNLAQERSHPPGITETAL